MRGFKVILFGIGFLIFCTPLFGANVLVTEMDLTSNVDLEGRIRTRGDFQISYDGGYKYQGKLLFQYLNANLENNTNPALIFNGAQASVNNVLNVVDITYWTGYYGILGEGKHYKGHLYHRMGGFDYNGYLPILGTGLIFGMSHYDKYTGQAFIYQRYGSMTVNSADIALGMNADALELKVFTGASDNLYRLGLQFVYFGDIADLYVTAGNPTIGGGRSLGFDDFYFLLEEWFRIRNWNLILSVFSRPKVYYNYLDRAYIGTDETNDIDFNFDLNYEPPTSYFSGGGELNIQTNDVEPFGVIVSPYVSVFAAGMTWKVKLDFNLISESREFITAYLNINASF